MIDQHLIAACQRKERQAFQQCYEACAPYVYSIIKHYVSDVSDRKDVMQEVFAQLFHSIGQYDARKASFKTWMSRITVNHTINFLKKNKKYSHLVPITQDLEEVPEVESTNAVRLDGQVLTQALQKMPTGYRTVFLLSYMEGYTHDEIAQILEITNKTSRSQLSRATKWLRTHYQDQLKAFNYG